MSVIVPVLGSNRTDEAQSKGITLRTGKWIIVLLMLSLPAGAETVAPKVADAPVYLTADFEMGQPLRYQFVTDRVVEINWDPSGTMSRGRNADSKVTESLEVVMLYEPVEVDPYGLSTIKATCQTAKTTKSKSPSGRAGGRDAVETLKGKSFTFTVDPRGRIVDGSGLKTVIQEAGDAAFRPVTDTSKGRIKEPDMIPDFTATQYFLYDAISSISHPSQGVVVGRSWDSQLLIPTPMVSRKARDVRYTLAELRPNPEGQQAVIKETYKLAESTPKDWPMPYMGSFQVAGMFGFLRGYKFLSLEGQGQEIYNIDAGRTESYTQKYVLKCEAMMMIPLGPNPQVTINQTITAKRLAN